MKIRDISYLFSLAIERHGDWLESDGRSGQQLVLQGLEFEGMDFRSSDLHLCHFEGSKFTGCNFEGVYLASTHFEGATLDGAKFNEAILTGVHFQGASLIGAEFSSACLEKVSFQGANLCGANLAEANFRRANLSGANLCGAYVLETNFSEATLSPLPMPSRNELVDLLIQYCKEAKIETFDPESEAGEIVGNPKIGTAVIARILPDVGRMWDSPVQLLSRLEKITQGGRA